MHKHPIRLFEEEVLAKPKAMRTKTQELDIPGLRYTEDMSAMEFVSEELPASKHFFCANYFKVVRDMGQFFIVFGEVSPFRSQKKMDRAVQIVLPVQSAHIFLNQTIWEKKGLNGSHTFGESLELTARAHMPESESGIVELDDLELPETENLRMFAANVCLVSVAQGQGSMEFLEASPSMVANIATGKKTRPDDSVSSVISIILDPVVMYSLLVKSKDSIGKAMSDLGTRIEQLKGR